MLVHRSWAAVACLDFGVVGHELGPGLRNLEAELGVHRPVVEHAATQGGAERHAVGVAAGRDVGLERALDVAEEGLAGERQEVLLRLICWKSDPELYTNTSSISPVARRVFIKLSPSAPAGHDLHLDGVMFGLAAWSRRRAAWPA